MHHIDGNKKNNKILNLQILTKSEHEKMHGITDIEQTKIGGYEPIFIIGEHEPIISPTAKIDWDRESEPTKIKTKESNTGEIVIVSLIIIILIGFEKYLLLTIVLLTVILKEWIFKSHKSELLIVSLIIIILIGFKNYLLLTIVLLTVMLKKWIFKSHE